VLQPGNAALLHHAILYRVDPGQVADAQRLDARDPRLGWSCFGGPGLPTKGNVLAGLDSAPWVGAFARHGGEQSFATGTGQQLTKGSQFILQMHYNLLDGNGSDNTSVKVRVAPAGTKLQALHTFLLPAPVELPCATNETAIQIDLIHADGTSRRLLDIPSWNFDDQRATELAAPTTVTSTDKLKVTCTHDATLRQKVPSLSKLQPRYVVWGEGSSDEMCLGVVSYTLMQ
jgi:hypothetical protein